MISFRGSSSVRASENCKEAPRGDSQSNEEWLRAQVDALTDDKVPSSFVVLLGGASVYDFRLRVAQSHLRGDLTPSHWSHVVMISTPTNNLNARAQVLEASLEPYEGFQVPSMHNGLQIAPLRRYASAKEYPNIAVIRVPVDSAEWRDNRGDQKSILAQFADQRVVLDVTTLMLEWLAYVWCAGGAGNPLLDGHGVPSAAVIESLLGAAGYDMSPGLDTSASSPEAFWQTAKWWQDYYEDMDIKQMQTRFHISDDGGVSEPQAPPANKSARATKKTTKKAAADRVGKLPERALSRDARLPRPTMFSAQSMTAKVFRQS